MALILPVAREIDKSGEPWIEAVNPRYRPLAPGVAPPTSSEVWLLQHERSEYLRERLEEFNATSALTSTGRPFDAILLPVMASCARPHKDRYDGEVLK